jgi:hypothetical protein
MKSLFQGERTRKFGVGFLLGKLDVVHVDGLRRRG